MQNLKQQTDEQPHIVPQTNIQNLDKISLIDNNIKNFKSTLKTSLIFASVRIIICCLFIFEDKIFISMQIGTNFSDSWNVIFYILSSLMDFLVILNDVQIFRFLKKQQPYLGKIKNQLRNNSPDIPNSRIGSYTIYLSEYDIIKIFKFQKKSLISISQTIRYLQMIITFYTFGNLALNAQNKNDTEFFKCFMLWLFMLSIYFSVFQLDFLSMETSSGVYVPQKKVNNSQNNEQSEQLSQLKDNYIKRIRRPFEFVYIISILLLLAILALYFQATLLSFMIIICIIANMAELIYEKYIQNRLITTDLNSLEKKYLTSYLILQKITKDIIFIHISICCFNRIAIVMLLMAYFRSLQLQNTQSFMLLFANFFLFLGQYLKFQRTDRGKLYLLRPQIIEQFSTRVQCSICLVNCEKEDKIVALPCFANHIYHFKCLKNWFQERKECPLCRQSLDIYELLQ